MLKKEFEIEKYSEEEARLLGLGIIKDLENNYNFFGVNREQKEILANKIANDVYPLNIDKDIPEIMSFTGHGLLYKAKLLKMLLGISK